MQATKDKIEMTGRLKKRSDYLDVQKNGAKWVSKGMIVHLKVRGRAEKDKQDICRFGITVSRRTDPRAVVRNRIKRRLRAVAYNVLSDYKLLNTDIVLIGRPETARRPFQDLEADLRWSLKRLGKMPATGQACKAEENSNED